MKAPRSKLSLCALAASIVFAVAGAASAQTDEDAAIGVSVARTSARVSGFGAGLETLTGTLFGVEGRASAWWLHARGEYRQGRLRSELSGEPSRDAVFASASLGVRPLPWLALTAGPRFVTIDADNSSRRVLRWRVQLHGSGPLIPDLAWGFASLGGSVAGNDAESASGGGGEVGVRFARQGYPIWATLGYRLDREQLTDGSWQAVELVYLGMGLSPGRRRDSN
jgi:hypothetical protein